MSKIFWSIAVVGIIVGAMGVADGRNSPYSGFFTNRNASVIRVFEDSPAAEAGFQLGDVILTSGGISIEDTKALTRRPRAEIGESRLFEIERAGEPMTLELVFGRQPFRSQINILLGFVVGLAFLLCSLLAYQKAPGDSTLLLALFGICFGLAFLPGPYSPSVFLRTLGGAFITLLVILGFSFLIHFLLSFPKRRPLLDKSWAKKAMYGPASLVALFLVFQIVFQPEATSALRQLTGIVVGLFIVGYFGWALVTMFQSYARATAEERSSHGVTLMLLGVLVGLLPVTISSLVGTISPDTFLPGAQYYGLTLGLIPIAFALATLRAHSATAAAT